jgi:hypothetical protein
MGNATAVDYQNLAPSGGLRRPERMRHCRGDVELHQGALERRRRGGVTIESGVSSAYHVMQNSGGGRKNGRGCGGRPRHTSNGGRWRSAKQGLVVGGGPIWGHRRVGWPRKEKGKWALPSKTVHAMIYTDANYFKQFQIQFKLVKS